MTILAKFLCNSIKETIYKEKIVKMNAVINGSEENKSFTSMTPSGSFQLSVTNDSPASNYFKVGKEYYFNISEAGE